jgi:hypothetical protein
MIDGPPRNPDIPEDYDFDTWTVSEVVWYVDLGPEPTIGLQWDGASTANHSPAPEREATHH